MPIAAARGQAPATAVMVEGVVIVASGTFDDGSGQLMVFVSARTEIDVSDFRTGQRLRVTGFSSRYEQHTELLPRTQGDIAAPSY